MEFHGKDTGSYSEAQCSHLPLPEIANMRGNSFGQAFRIHTFGESHGAAIGVIIDGCPAGIRIDLDSIQKELDRRRPGQSALTTERQEADRVSVVSGIMDGITLGTPITLVMQNKDSRPSDYDRLKDLYRPSHADYTWDAKFGVRDHRGGGRSSARETAARVAAGAVARQILALEGVSLVAWVSQVGPIRMPEDFGPVDRTQVENHFTRCPDPATAEVIASLIGELKEKGDSVGGIIGCRIDGCPPGWGEPVFDKLGADLGKAVLSINACKAFEIGSGFDGCTRRGSELNDLFTWSEGAVRTSTNHSGGIQGGISNGMPIEFRAGFKPVASIALPQKTITRDGDPTTITVEGRHDPCVLPRAVPIVEAMAAIVLTDHFLRQKTTRS